MKNNEDMFGLFGLRFIKSEVRSFHFVIKLLFLCWFWRWRDLMGVLRTRSARTEELVERGGWAGRGCQISVPGT